MKVDRVFVRPLTADEQDWLSGLSCLTPTEVTITGPWEPTDLRLACSLCGLKFRPDETVAEPLVSVNGGPYLPCCAACAVQRLVE